MYKIENPLNQWFKGLKCGTSSTKTYDINNWIPYRYKLKTLCLTKKVFMLGTRQDWLTFRVHRFKVSMCPVKNQ